MRLGAYCRNLANIIEPFICGGDAACCEITLTTRLSMSRFFVVGFDFLFCQSFIYKNVIKVACMYWKFQRRVALLNTQRTKLEMWANAQREYRWRPLFDAAKFA